MESRPPNRLEDQEKLLGAVKNGQVDVMETLLRNPEVKVDYVYPNLGTCLEVACRTTSPKSDQVVKFLLEKVQPKEVRPEPIHHAAEHGNHLALREILRHKTCRVNAEDGDGRTALHLTAKNFEKNPDNYGICLELLLECPTIDINRPNMDNCTAIREAAESGGREVVVKMLELRPTGFDLDSHLYRGCTARQVILNKFPDLKIILPIVKVATRHTSEPQALLLEGILNNHLEVFKGLLQQVDHDGTPVMDPNYIYGQPYWTTCVQEACSEGKPIQYLEALLRANANPNLVNVFTSKAPIHVAISRKNLKVMELLLDQATLNVNVSDVYGDTPLHYVVRFVDDEQQAELLIRQLLAKGAIVDVKNKVGNTPITEAALLKKKEIVKAVLPETDIEQEITNGVTLKSFIQTHLPEMVHVSLERQNTDIKNRLKRKLFLMLYVENCHSFVKELESLELTATEMKELLNEDDGKNTFLQTACSLKNSKCVVQVLLKKGVDPNLTIKESSSPPLVMAAEKKKYDVMKVMLDNARDQLDVNKGDKKGRTALHVVVKDRNLEMVVMLLNAGAKILIRDNLGKRPITTAALKDLMDMSLQADEEKFPYDDDYRIKLSFALFIRRQKNQRQSPTAPESYQPPKSAASSWQEKVERGLLNDSDEDGNRTTNVAGNEYCGAGVQTEAARLWYITGSYPEDSILKHPLVKSFIDLKWRKFQAYYYANLACVFLFTLFVNIFIILRCNETGECSDITSTYLVVLISVFWTGIVIRELIQLFTSFREYIENNENKLDYTLIIFTVFSVFVKSDVKNVQFLSSVLTVLLSWLQLFLVSGRHPLLSEYMQILKTVTINFLLFLVWYSTILVSFATCFFILLRANNDSFSNFGLSLFNVIIMMNGDLNSDSIEFDAFPFLSYPLFVVFFFLVTIVLFNLLNGLAVSDIQKIKETATLLSIRSRVRLIRDIEHHLMIIYKRRIPLVSRVLSLDRIVVFPAETFAYIYPNSNSYVHIGDTKYKLKMDPSVLSEITKIIGDKPERNSMALPTH